jgi:hypothetical protein
MMLEVDAGGMAVDVDPSHQQFLKFCYSSYYAQQDAKPYN